MKTINHLLKVKLRQFANGLCFVFFLFIFLFATHSSQAQFNDVFLLNGTDAYVEIPNKSVLNALVDNFTIEAWINPCSSTGNQVIISKEHCSNLATYSFYLSVSNGNLFWSWVNQDSRNCGSSASSYLGSISISPNVWTHVALIHQSTGITMYINGIKDTGGTLTGSLGVVTVSTTPMRIAAYEGTSNNFGAFFNGGIDELRIWTEARSQTEIQTYKGVPLVGNEANLLAYYDMDITGSGAGLAVPNKASATATAQINGTSVGNALFTPLTSFVSPCCPAMTLTGPNPAYTNGTNKFVITINNPGAQINGANISSFTAPAGFKLISADVINGLTNPHYDEPANDIPPIFPVPGGFSLPTGITTINIYATYTVLQNQNPGFDQCFTVSIPGACGSQQLCLNTKSVIGCPGALSFVTVNSDTEDITAPSSDNVIKSTTLAFHSTFLDITGMEFCADFDPQILQYTGITWDPTVTPYLGTPVITNTNGHLTVHAVFTSRVDINDVMQININPDINHAPFTLNFRILKAPTGTCHTQINSCGTTFHTYNQPDRNVPTDYAEVSFTGAAAGCISTLNPAFTASPMTVATGQTLTLTAAQTTGTHYWLMGGPSGLMLANLNPNISYVVTETAPFDIVHYISYNGQVAQYTQTINVVSPFNNALDLDGTVSYAEMPDNSAIRLTDTFTVEAWVRPCNLTGVIVAKQWCAGNQSGFYLSLDGGKLKWVFDNDGNCGTVPNVYMSNNVIATLNTWVHVAVVHHSTGVSLYVNGILVPGTLTGVNATVYPSNNPLRIGVYEGLSGNYGVFFQGLIDEVRVWKTARTNTQIYNSMSTPLIGTETNLVAYYNMDGITGGGQNIIVPNYAALTGSALNGSTKGNTTVPTFVVNNASVCTGFKYAETLNTVDPEAASVTQVTVVPNPVINVATFVFNQQSGQHILEVTNQLGALVSSQVFTDGSVVSFDKKGIAAGMYVFVITNTDKNIQYKGKFVVE